jgi:hypothetical protein
VGHVVRTFPLFCGDDTQQVNSDIRKETIISTREWGDGCLHIPKTPSVAEVWPWLAIKLFAGEAVDTRALREMLLDQGWHTFPRVLVALYACQYVVNKAALRDSDHGRDPWKIWGLTLSLVGRQLR